jgi:hypothetical protein
LRTRFNALTTSLVRRSCGHARTAPAEPTDGRPSMSWSSA